MLVISRLHWFLDLACLWKSLFPIVSVNDKLRQLEKWIVPFEQFALRNVEEFIIGWLRSEDSESVCV